MNNQQTETEFGKELVDRVNFIRKLFNAQEVIVIDETLIWAKRKRGKAHTRPIY